MCCKTHNIFCFGLKEFNLIYVNFTKVNKEFFSLLNDTHTTPIFFILTIKPALLSARVSHWLKISFRIFIVQVNWYGILTFSFSFQ